MNTMLKEFISKSYYGPRCLKTSNSDKICVYVPDRGVQLMVELDGLSVEIRKKGSRSTRHSCYVFGVKTMDTYIVNAIDRKIEQMIEMYAVARPKKPVMQTPTCPNQVLTHYVASRLLNTVGVSDVEFWTGRRPSDSSFAGYWGTSFTFMNHEFLMWFNSQNQIQLNVATGKKENPIWDLSSHLGGCLHGFALVSFDKILSSLLMACKRYAESQEKAVKIKQAQNALETICKRYGVTKADLLGKEAK